MTHAANGTTRTHKQYPLTLVTAYFDLGASQQRYAGNPYPGWIRNFLPFARWPLVIFCDERSVDMLKEARAGKPAVYRVTSPEEFHAYKYRDDLKRIEFRTAKPLEANLVWHEKHHFLRRALSENPFKSEMFFWCDIGMFRFRRDAPLRGLFRSRHVRLYEDVEWPNLEVCRALPRDKVFIQMSSRDCCAGERVFGGAAEPVHRWCDAYYQQLERRARKGTIPCTEGLVMMSAWNRQPELAHVLSHTTTLRRLPARSLIAMVVGIHTHLIVWYLLKGGRFPWKYARRRFFPGLGK